MGQLFFNFSGEENLAAAALPPTLDSSYEQRKERERARNAMQSRIGRDIAPIPAVVNRQRRDATRHDLRLFCETYLQQVFRLDWSPDHVRAIETIQRCALDGGLFAIGMPRGSGKSVLCRSACLWVMLHGHHPYAALIGATQEMACGMLLGVKTQIETNPLIVEDFPEVCYPVRRLAGISNRAPGQVCDGQRTYITWTSDKVILPTIPGSTASGGIITVAGLTSGNIRGLVHHTADGRVVRPSFVLNDDPQTDESARSVGQCLVRSALINGALLGLVEPDRPMSVLMPVTVIRQGDVADEHLDRSKRPEWLGVRMPLVRSWPDGITDTTIDELTPAGRLWSTYKRLHERSLRKYEDIHLATKWYARHRAAMDAGFEVSWQERFVRAVELSAQQHAMNLRFRNGDAFLAEYQLVGVAPPEEVHRPGLTAVELSHRVIASLPRGELPIETQHLVGMVDVQDEVLFWSVLAVGPDFTGAVVDYGTWPSINSSTFAKFQVQQWALLTRSFFAANPEQFRRANRRPDGTPVAPLDAKLYHAFQQFIPAFVSRSYVRQDPHRTPVRLSRVGIDIRWGLANAAVKGWISRCGLKQVIPYVGQSFPPQRKQLEEYTPTKGWLFEHQRHPSVKDAKWVVRASQDGQYYLEADVNRLKDFLFQRLSTPLGSRGSIALFAAPPERHALYASHVCESEYPEPTTARGMTKNLWQVRAGRPDNDWLDTTVGCLALASLDGACLQMDGMAPIRRRGKRHILDGYAKE